eukprot:g41541.t1
MLGVNEERGEVWCLLHNCGKESCTLLFLRLPERRQERDTGRGAGAPTNEDGEDPTDDFASLMIHVGLRPWKKNPFELQNELMQSARYAPM